MKIQESSYGLCWFTLSIRQWRYFRAAKGQLNSLTLLASHATQRRLITVSRKAKFTNWKA